jgi:hypothetical protein
MTENMMDQYPGEADAMLNICPGMGLGIETISCSVWQDNAKFGPCKKRMLGLPLRLDRSLVSLILAVFTPKYLNTLTLHE